MPGKTEYLNDWHRMMGQASSGALIKIVQSLLALLYSYCKVYFIKMSSKQGNNFWPCLGYNKCSEQRIIIVKKRVFQIALIAALLQVLTTVVACGKNAPAMVQNQTSTHPVVLTVANGTKIKTFSIAQIEEMPNLSGFAGQIDNSNKISGPIEYKGVALTDILNTIGGISTGNRVKITSSNNNAETFSYNQVTNGNIDIYDGLSGLTTTAPVMVPKLFVAFESNGAPLEAGTGPLEFGVMTCQFRVTRAALWVKNVIKIEVIQVK